MNRETLGVATLNLNLNFRKFGKKLSGLKCMYNWLSENKENSYFLTGSNSAFLGPLLTVLGLLLN